MDYTDITCFPPDDKKIRLVLKKSGKNPLLVLGLNPSTADETHPDATIIEADRVIIDFGNLVHETAGIKIFK